MRYKAIPPMLVKDIAQGDCVLFIGAGLSMAAGLPGWRELMEPLCDHLERCYYFKIGEDTDPLKVAQVFEHKERRRRLIEHIIEQIRTTGINPTELHIKLAKLGINIWITTNYDRLIEKTFEDPRVKKPYFPVVRDTDLTLVPPGAVTLIKMHGDIFQTDTLIITRNDYFTKFPLIRKEIAGLLVKKTFLFIGYSLQDPDFNQLQAEITYYLKEYSRRAYAVLKDIDEFNLADLESRNIDVIDLSGWGDDGIS